VAIRLPVRPSGGFRGVELGRYDQRPIARVPDGRLPLMQQLTLEHDADFGSRYTPPPPAPRRPQRRRRRRRRRNDPVRSAFVAVAPGALLCILLAVSVIIFHVWVANTAEAMIAEVPNTPQ